VVTFYDTFVWTQYASGEGYGGTASHDDAYYRLAKRLGYGQDIYWYCKEHDFLHSFLMEEAYERPSRVLLPLAHGRQPRRTAGEEATVQLFQAFMRADWDMTATDPDVDWWAIREKAYAVLDGPDLPASKTHRVYQEKHPCQT
jgi:hypothetical protein